MTTTTMVIMRDAAWPSNIEPSTAAELVYAGGDTPNPEIWDTSTARFRVPCWVRSNPGNVSYIGDAEMFLRWLDNNKVPPGVVTVLDLEMAVDPYYVNGYGTLLHNAGYLVWPYGSTNYLFQNPALDGYFAADPTGVEHLYPGTVATQYAALGAYDLSVIAAGASLWDTQPPPPPDPPPLPDPPPEEDPDTMLIIFWTKNETGASAAFVSDGIWFRWIENDTILNDIQTTTGPSFLNGKPVKVWNDATVPVADPKAFGTPANKETADQLGYAFP